MRSKNVVVFKTAKQKMRALENSKRKNRMATGTSDLVDIVGELRRDDLPRSYGIWFGDTYEDGREKLIFLSRDHTQHNGGNSFTLPRWLAEKAGVEVHIVD